jgi:hypothetical protein
MRSSIKREEERLDHGSRVAQRTRRAGVATPSGAPLTISAPDDPCEREADAMADRIAGPLDVVVGGLDVQPRGGPFVVQREPGEGAARRPAAPPTIGAEIARRQGLGRRLPPGIQSTMAARFGHDLAAVRVHTDAAAADLSRRLSARAFTAGPDIFFNAGQYSPHTPTGARLLAHELTHTIQQASAARPQIMRSIDLTTIGPAISDAVGSAIVGSIQAIEAHSKQAEIRRSAVQNYDAMFMKVLLGAEADPDPAWVKLDLEAALQVAIARGDVGVFGKLKAAAGMIPVVLPGEDPTADDAKVQARVQRAATLLGIIEQWEVVARERRDKVDPHQRDITVLLYRSTDNPIVQNAKKREVKRNIVEAYPVLGLVHIGAVLDAISRKYGEGCVGRLEIYGHGDPGSYDFGAEHINGEQLKKTPFDFSRALRSGAVISLLGCSAGAGFAGYELLMEVGRIFLGKKSGTLIANTEKTTFDVFADVMPRGQVQYAWPSSESVRARCMAEKDRCGKT